MLPNIIKIISLPLLVIVVIAVIKGFTYLYKTFKEDDEHLQKNKDFFENRWTNVQEMPEYRLDWGIFHHP